MGQSYYGDASHYYYYLQPMFFWPLLIAVVIIIVALVIAYTCVRKSRNEVKNCKFVCLFVP